MTILSKEDEARFPNLARLFREHGASPERQREVNERLKGLVMVTMSPNAPHRLKEEVRLKEEKEEEQSDPKEDHGTDSEES